MYEKYITLNNRSTASIVNAHTQRNLELETKWSLSQVSSPPPWWFSEKENRNVGEGGRIQEPQIIIQKSENELMQYNCIQNKMIVLL